jgi:hypothetical protein
MPFTTESGSDYQVKITSTSNPSTLDFSDGNFTIVGNEITITSPTGGENWLVGEAYLITWEDNLVGNLEIHLLNRGVLDKIISANTVSDGTYAWEIPSDVEQGNDFTIRIASVDEGSINDESDFFTITEPTAVEKLYNGIPDNYELLQNYPNPFNPSTTIHYALPINGSIEFTIYDVLGTELWSVKEEKPAGYHKIEFNGTGFNSGIYFYRLEADSYTATKKMILFK